MHKEPNYVVISPVRNEGRYLRKTIQSMVSQTTPPAKWIIVNDGSTDDTGEIADEAARAYPWIHSIKRPDRGYRKAGGGVVDAFYEGFRLVENDDWEYLVKLDGDVTFRPDYFEGCYNHFANDAKLGIAGGLVCDPESLEAESKVDPKFHVRGATKIYRRDCWMAIGGLLSAPGWDTLDEVKANMLGWQTHTIKDIPIVHHRPTGAAYGTWNDRVKAGLANYISGYHPLFMLLKGFRRMIEAPVFLGGCGLLFGYCKGYFLGVKRVDDEQLIKYFQAQQMNRLLGRSSLWDK